LPLSKHISQILMLQSTNGGYAFLVNDTSSSRGYELFSKDVLGLTFFFMLDFNTLRVRRVTNSPSFRLGMKWTLTQFSDSFWIWAAGILENREQSNYDSEVRSGKRRYNDFWLPRDRARGPEAYLIPLGWGGRAQFDFLSAHLESEIFGLT